MTVFNILLYTHVITAGISLIAGLIVIFLKKGNALHKKIGSLYYYVMLTCALVAIPMCYMHPNYFLFIISIFTIYMLLTGKRYLAKKSIADVTNVDWALAILMAVFGSAFVVFGILHLVKSNNFGIVFIVFGLISYLFVYQDWKNFKGRSPVKNYFLTSHLQRFIGSYIASATAFLVVNNTILPAAIAWLLPTVLFAPLIRFWSNKYKVVNKK